MTDNTSEKIAFVFPGQGAQQVAMGRSLANEHNDIKKIYDQANDIVGYDLAKLCFEGPEDRLNTTEYSQPALFTTSVACLRALRMGILEAGFADTVPNFCAGLSLGEYTALHAAGAVTFEEGLKLVQLRGRAMQQAAEQSAGSMVSILGLDEEPVTKLCAAAREQADPEPEGSTVLEPVNFNCPGQIVISGTKNACAKAAELADAFGALKAIPLKVAGAFHTSLMTPAADQLRSALEQTQFAPMTIPTLANVTGRPYDTANPDVTNTLLSQLTSPVRWQQCVEYLFDQNTTTFLEIGPGRVLTGLIKKTARQRKLKINLINISA